MMQPQSIHLIGIGGAGLSAIATVLLQEGYTISGSDLHASPATERLARLGASVHIGHAPANLGEVDLVVVSSAVPADNPELEAAHGRGIPVVKRAEWLGRMMSGKRGVAVAGTHGKTTTTAMIALILRQAGLDPTFIVGGDIPQLGTNAAAGKSDLFVIEADEYDHTFLGLRPEIAVITVVEWDHPDCYPTPESMVRAFQEFLALVPAGGQVVACGDEPSVQELIERLEGWKDGRMGGPQLITYGLDAGNHWRASDVRTNARGGYDFSIITDRPIHQPANPPTFQASTSVPGIHNLRNGLAALVVADSLGVPVEQAAATLADFKGVGRRFEVKGQVGGVLVIDDYAHHPTEIRATLAAVRTNYPEREVWVVFQPHTYSRTRALLGGFAKAFEDAHHVLILDIFPARETDDGSISSGDILALMKHADARHIGSLAEAADFLRGQLRPGDLLITMGAGDGYRVGDMVLAGVGSKE